ncbi:MAG: DUF357 domain-containing protein [Candidatus Aenigmarchaeota archaeon]|nr:DUF357 domain-containing protein [Candidatus Aenigmarchaeota archaeon]
MQLENNLKEEIEKWTKKAKEKRKNLKLIDDSRENMIKNIDAYIKDSQYFLEKGDLVRSFEAITWAWSWMEILQELDIVAEVC